MNKIKISGFKDEKRMVNAEFKRIEDGNTVCRGYVLDEINLNITLNNQKDLNQLLLLLHVLTPCLNDEK